MVTFIFNNISIQKKMIITQIYIIIIIFLLIFLVETIYIYILFYIILIVVNKYLTIDLL